MSNKTEFIKTTKGNVFELMFYEEEGIVEARGPLPKYKAGPRGVVAKVKAKDMSEARNKLIKELVDKGY